MFTLISVLVCIVLLALKFNIFQKRINKLPYFEEIILVDSSEKCGYAVQRIRTSNCVLGFDCEWVNDKPVSLIQLATPNGVCALFRIGIIGHVPPALEEILADGSVIKVGVAAFEDGQRLWKDYNIQVLGTLDLRRFANYVDPPSPKSLADLSSHFLGVQMDKNKQIRCGDWDANILTDKQIDYAARDALVSVLVYQKIKEREGKKSVLHPPPGLLDQRFRIKQSNNVDKIKINDIVTHEKHKTPTRNKPLYNNCYLQAPDGEILCTCDYKKAERYVEKGLAEIVEREPFTVKLKFEPSGRAVGDAGQYYVQVQVNRCVVCGSFDNFVRKNVVPREYRKYFPVVMKAHQTYDILLLCLHCHRVSNCHDLRLRKELADMCGAPLFMTNARRENSEWKKMNIAVKLLLEPSRLSTEKRLALESFVLKNTSEEYLTVEMLEKLHQDMKSQSFPIASSTSDSHGIKVVEFFKQTKGGLVELERLWRQHFIDTTNPQYLPSLWSVKHNHERLAIRQTQNRIEPKDAKIAGIDNITT